MGVNLVWRLCLIRRDPEEKDADVTFLLWLSNGKSIHKEDDDDVPDMSAINTAKHENFMRVLLLRG